MLLYLIDDFQVRVQIKMMFLILFAYVTVSAADIYQTSSEQGLRSNAIVCLDSVYINEGQAYNPSTGKFTAPRDGIYKFEWTFLTKPGHLFISALVRNGKIVAYNHAGDHQNNNWDSSTQSVFLRLTKGEQVWIQVRGGDGRYLHGDTYSTFSGQSI
ncbi:hypothetical protein FSP39_025436 [Pinctada imbricata]|uniref:C1q domain-containing protein n=1 Tax=Pinctada imbricata TaxID=66713 RepID=A0AA89C9F8_PINIB|nr:hypothetical protein FSP39_025436 [Pinctada imbricata]